MLRKIYEEKLAKITKDVEEPETHQRVRLDARRILVRQRILRDLKGDNKEQNAINRIDGTPAETVQFKGGGGAGPFGTCR